MKIQGPRFDLLKGGWEEIGPGLYGPGTFEVTFEGPELPYKVEMELTLQAGRYECSRLECIQKGSGPPVSGEGIRQLPVTRLIVAAALRALHADKDLGSRLTSLMQLIPKGTSGEGPTDQNLRYVALIYRAAYACHYDPTKAVMEALGLSRPTAGRWVMKARDAGYLGETEERRAGGLK